MITKTSIIIPVKNEEKIINNSLKELKKQILKNNFSNYEIILIINDTQDRTELKIKKFIKNNPSINIKLTQSNPGYGNALMKGFKIAKGEIIVILNADFINEDIIKFSKYQKDLNYDLIIGSKRAPYSIDKRPFIRKFVTKIFNIFLKIIFNFKGTDTHGVKSITKESLNKILKKLQKHKNNSSIDIVDTILVLESNKLGFKILEIPVKIKEIRKTRFKNRFFSTFKDLYILFKTLK